MNLTNLNAALTRYATAVLQRLNSKVDKVAGKQLSTEDYSTAEKNKLAGVKSMGMRELHTLAGVPGAGLGADGDFAYDTLTGDLYFKDAGVWETDAGGDQTGGIGEAPNDGGYYFRRQLLWERLNRYDLKVVTTTNLMDLAAQQVFVVDGTANRTLQFTWEPPADRAMAAIVRINGTGGVITWPANILWNKNVAPVLGTTFTVVTLVWTGSDWIGTVSATA